MSMAQIELEHAPRGAVTLLVSRSGANVSVTVPPGAWAATVRPAFGQAVLSRYQQGRELLAKEIDKAVGVWRDLAVRRRRGNCENVGWALVQVGLAAQGEGDYAAARASYEESLSIQRELGGQRQCHGSSVCDSVHMPPRATVCVWLWFL